MNLALGRAAAAEAVGTFAFVFVGAAAVCADAYSGGELGLLGIALAHAAALAAAIAATATLSGGHLNPAITLAALVVRAVEPVRAAAYVVAQVLGAIAAGAALRATFAADVWEPVRLGAPVLGPGVEVGTGIVFEAALTFFLVFVFLRATEAWSPLSDIATASPEAAMVGAASRGGAVAAATGAALLAVMLIGGPITGAAVNPARALGPALAAGGWTDQHVYWIGPLLGGVVAAVVRTWLSAAPSPAPHAAHTDEEGDGATVLPLDPSAGAE